MTTEIAHEFATSEVERTDCFLCRPVARLLADVGPESFTMAGIGPLTPCYAIVSTVEHLDQLKDTEAIEKFATYADGIRRALVAVYGSCVLTEHGHSPLCTLANTHTVHCFHPHVLLFPGAPGIQGSATQSLQNEASTFTSLADALKFGRDLDQYLLVSDTPTSFSVFPAEGGLPRQFARGLVAEALGNIDHASWREFPALEEAVANAAKLKAIIKGDS
jgi:hypothetical protein